MAGAVYSVAGHCEVNERFFLVADIRRGRVKAKANQQKRGVADDAPAFLRSYAEWKGYVNVSVSDAEKGRFRTFVDDTDLVQEHTAEVLLHGYKITCVQEDEDGIVKATAFSAFVGRSDSGLSVSAYAEGLWAAIASVVYLVAFVAQYDLAKFETERSFGRKSTF